MSHIDPSILQDFLTECTELVDQLDADLVRLEDAASNDQLALLNSIFRAVHTIKGGAGFLELEEVTRFAHAAEDALNHLRQDASGVGPSLIDTLLRSADLLREQVQALAAGAAVPAAPDALVDELRQVIGSPPDRPDTAAAPSTGDHAPPAARLLSLPPEKAELVGCMGSDLRDAAAELQRWVGEAADPEHRPEAAEHLVEMSDGLAKTIDFFDLDELRAPIALLRRAGEALPQLADEPSEVLCQWLDTLHRTIGAQADALERGEVLQAPTDALGRQVEAILAGEPVGTDAPATPAPAPADPPVSSPVGSPAGDAEPRAAEQTIRVEVGRLETLLNLVGQMVLAKNRMLGIGRKLQAHNLPQELAEEVNAATNDLDRFTGELQVGVMQTRMQPLAKVFDRYPRVIRDVARATGKKMQLEIAGKETEVDKGVLELLADPLVHVLRNSADHGLEPPDERAAAGKPETGTIYLQAEHRGSHVHVSIRDDGRGLDRDAIGVKAVANGLTTEEQLAALTDQEVYEFIFAPGFSTAEQVSDLSGRGVGMDVVRTNVSRMNGAIHIDSTPGEGTTFELQIPLTVAIMPAMAVGVAGDIYCVPLQNIVEIVRPADATGCTVHDQPVIRLRDQVLPLIDLRERLAGPADAPARFALVVNAAGQRAGLLLDRLVGQQDIVIKPLDDAYTRGGPFSGATIQDTGEVSLILDVPKLVRQANAGDNVPPRHAA